MSTDRVLPADYNVLAPDSSEVRLLAANARGSMAHTIRTTAPIITSSPPIIQIHPTAPVSSPYPIISRLSHMSSSSHGLVVAVLMLNVPPKAGMSSSISIWSS